MIRLRYPVSAVVAAFGLVSLSGCFDTASVSPEVLAKHRSRLLLSEEPDNVQILVEVRETLLGTADSAHREHNHSEHSGVSAPEHEHAAGDDDDHEHEHEREDDDDDNDHHAHAEEDPHDDDDDDADSHEAHEHGHQEASVALPTDSLDVVLVGQIGGLANPWAGTQADFPFENNQAKFFLADPGAVAEAEASGHSHEPGEECTFCARHAKDNSELLAVVRFFDELGAVLPIDTRELFDVKENDMVVVCGKARVIEGGILVVDATGIYVRR